MRRALIRAARTFFQSAIGTFLALGVLQGVVDAGAIDLDALARAAVSAGAAGVISVLSFIQNALEDLDKIPTIGGDKG